MTRLLDTIVGTSAIANLVLLAGATPTVGSASVVRRQSNTTAALPSSCANGGTFRYSPQTASGWKVIKVAGSLRNPRGMVFDTKGRILMVQSGTGLFQYTLAADGCIASSKQLVSLSGLNHGIALSPDGATLYASTSSTAYSWPYNAEAGTIGTQTTLVKGMNTKGHVTRTLTVSRKNPNVLVISHGSDGNFDYPSENPAVGRSCVKAFDLSKAPSGGYTYAADGWMMGYGLRNEIGIVFDGNEMLWGVENSGDNFKRGTTDIHIDNPAEELNFLGDVTKPNDQWYGYPACYTAWDPSVFPDQVKPAVGSVFAYQPNTTFTDDSCKTKSVAPRLSFQAHSAPIDAVFDAGYKNMYVTFHGSWNRSPPTGFKVVVIPFKNGTNGYEPVAAADSKTGYTDVLWNSDVTKCSSQCFRPAGIIADSKGRFYVSSDGGEGELFLLGKA